MDTKTVAQTIFEALGGNDNIISMVYCATRLRFVLSDDSIVNEHALAQISEVSGTFRTSGQYQIILGMGTVKTVHDQLLPLLTPAEPSVGTDSLNPVKRAVKALSDLVGKE
ncbi:PTS transporter subunit EIIB [Tolumonas lignilytica]|uniref:PTS transporter subunit EIIB n=1 Tax=Tolumonas lignilytica TaxID=1283284 RepID=UPI0004646187|nr:PTS transporter subunit EIIB [Tolumonas lignilytica]